MSKALREELDDVVASPSITPDIDSKLVKRVAFGSQAFKRRYPLGRIAFKHFVFGTPPRGYQGSGAFKPPLYVQLSLFFLDLFMNCDFSSRHKFPEAITYHLGRDL